MLGVVVGCGGSFSPTPLANSHGSSAALARAVLAGLERRDQATLQGLTLTEQEFKDHVWPELPAARPERNLPFSYVWGDLRQKSETQLTATLATYGGRPYTLIRVEHAGETTRYATYLVHRETVLVVRNASGGEERLRVYGSTLEKDGAFKVFSYVVDD
jgi:hypothetical protein